MTAPEPNQPTREEMAEACRHASSHFPRLTVRLDLERAAAQLERDGKLREELERIAREQALMRGPILWLLTEFP